MEYNRSTIVNIIEAFRKSEELTQTELGKMLNMSLRGYCQKENLKRDFKLTEILKAFEIFDINLKVGTTIINNYKDILKVIIDKRKSSKLSQDLIRQKIGLKSHPAYSQKELGKTSFTLIEFIDLCNILELRITIEYNLNNQNVKVVL